MATHPLARKHREGILLLHKEQLMSAEQLYPELIEVAEQRRRQLVGSIALKSCATVVEVEPNEPTTLLSALSEARFGNEAALSAVRTNVATDVAERLFKAGHQTQVTLHLEDGHLSQNGMRLSDVHKNTLNHMPLNPLMRQRTEQELQNALLYEEMLAAGLLESYDVVVFSPAPTDETTRRDYNFFTDTDSLSIQYLTTNGDTVIMETAMVAGKVSPLAQRHDLLAIQQLLEEAGMRTDLHDPDEALSHVLLVEKSPNGGVHDIVKRYDEIVGNTFYGQQKPGQDYSQYRAVCQERTRSFEPIVDKITCQLLAEAHTFATPLDAIKRLDRLSDKFCLERASLDMSIDARVFGSKAAVYIEQARAMMAQGNMQAASLAMQAAGKASVSSSCPLFRGSPAEPADEMPSLKGAEDKYGSLSFHCPHCRYKNTRKPNKLIKHCQKCSKDVSCK